MLFIFFVVIFIQNSKEFTIETRNLQGNVSNETKVDLLNYTKLTAFQLVEISFLENKILTDQRTLRKINFKSYNPNSTIFSTEINNFLQTTLVSYVATNTLTDFELKFKIFNNQNSDFYFFLNLTDKNSSTPIADAFTIQYIYPNRLSLGENKTFISIFRQSSIPNVLMPTNSPINDLNLLEISSSKYPNSLSPPNFALTQSDTSPYVTYWTFAKDQSMLYIPWIPFFTNCEGYGNKILWFDLLENNQKCIFRTVEETNIVSAIPTSGLEPTADYCNLKIKCSFSEPVNMVTTLIKWWQIEDKTALYYIPSYGVLPNDYLSNRDSRTDYFSTLIDANTDDIVPVNFYSDNFKTNSYPSTVTLKLQYYQISKTQKKLVKATVILSDFVTINENNLHPKYNLNVVFSAMDFLDLINAFQFDVFVYLLAFILFSFFTIFGIVLFWGFNKTISKRENPPILKLGQTVKLVIIPQIFGTIIGTCPVFFMILIVYSVNQGDLFGTIYYAFDEGSITDQTAITMRKRGRLGMMLVIISFLILYFGSCLIISLPTREEEKIIVNNMKKKAKEEQNDNLTNNSQNSQDDSKSSYSPVGSEDSIQDSSNKEMRHSIKKSIKNDLSKEKSKRNLNRSFDGSEENEGENMNILNNEEKWNEEEDFDKGYESASLNEEEEDEEEKDDDYQIRTVITRKRYHYVFITFFCGLFFIIFLELSYMSAFNDYLSLFIIGFILIQALLVTFLQKNLLQETLLISPIISAFEIIQFITVMASATFESFIFSYLIRMSLLIGLRTYIDPIIKNIRYFMNKLNLWLISKNQKFDRFLKKYIVMKKDDKLEFYLGSTVGSLENDKLFEEDSSLEPVLTILLSYTSMVHSAFIRPFIICIIRIFPNESQIPKLYGFKIQDLDYYLLFSFVCVFSQFIIDIFMMNSLEVLHGFKLFEYFSFCEFRYNSRKVKWIPHNFNLDKSIQIQYRSLHNLCFSTQFYLINTILIYGICILSIGVSIIIRNNYIFVEDPVFFALIFFFSSLMLLSKIIIIFLLTYFFNIWKIPAKKENLPLQSINQYLNTGGFKIESIMEADLFRKHFIQYNKEWILKNLKLVIKPEHFEENDGYLIGLYNVLKGEAAQEGKEKRREEMLIRKKEGRGYSKFKEDVQASVDNNGEEDIHEEILYNNEDNILKIPQHIMDNLEKILQFWLYYAKETGYLKKLVQDIVNKKKEGSCRHCGIDVELNIRENVPFLQLVRNFRVRLAGLPFNKDEWRKYYEKNQRFITLCSDCDLMHVVKNKQKMLNYTKKLLTKKNEKNVEKDVSKLIFLKWLLLARSSLLHKRKKQD